MVGRAALDSAGPAVPPYQQTIHSTLFVPLEKIGYER